MRLVDIDLLPKVLIGIDTNFMEAVIMPVVNVIKEDWLNDLQNLIGALRQTFEKERETV